MKYFKVYLAVELQYTTLAIDNINKRKMTTTDFYCTHTFYLHRIFLQSGCTNIYTIFDKQAVFSLGKQKDYCKYLQAGKLQSMNYI